MFYNVNFFQKDYNAVYGSIEYAYGKNNEIIRDLVDMTDINFPVAFYDDQKEFGGNFIWKKYSKEKEQIVNEIVNKETQQKVIKKTSVVYYMMIEITKNKNNMSPREIMCYFKKNVSDNLKNVVIKQYCRVTIKSDGKSGNDTSTIYNGKIRKIDELEALYMDPFFHPMKDRLWSFIKQLHFHPEEIIALGQTPQYNLLLHGPPGTGKSSFGYRIAMALTRNIISVDFRHIQTKSSLCQLFTYPNISSGSPNDVVFLLDEFDISIRFIYEKEHNRQLRRELVTKKLEKARRLLDLPNNSKPNHYKTRKYLKKNHKDSNQIRSKICDEDLPLLEDVESDEEEDVHEAFISKYMLMQSSCLKEMQEMDESVNLKDLLDIFQGPVPNNGAIIIATTNDYEEIYNMCPALFRPGRLTPIHFGYPDRTIIQDISQYYFNKIPTFYVQEQTKTPTSAFIQIAIDNVVQYGKEKGYAHFENDLEKLLKRDSLKE